MTLRILGGIAKGVPLHVPETEEVRPTSVLLKRRVFDRHQHLDGHHFIDLCAGAGGMGFEAWSRGADSVTMVELNTVAMKTLERNLSLIKERYPEEFKERPIKLIKSSAQKALSQLSFSEETILFLDPPYADAALYTEVISQLSKKMSEGQLWIESQEPQGQKLSDLQVLFSKHFPELPFDDQKVFKQGKSFILLAHF